MTLAPSLRESQGVFAAQSATGSGDDNDAILHSRHGLPLFLGLHRPTLLKGRFGLVVATLEQPARQLPRPICIRRVDEAG